MSKQNFIERCVNGTVKDPFKEMGLEVIAWMVRKTNDKRSYREFLGMTHDEYKMWYSRSDNLDDIIKARREQLAVKIQDAVSLASRGTRA